MNQLKDKEVGLKKRNKTTVTHHTVTSTLNINVTKAWKQVEFSINIANSYSHSSMLLLLSVLYSCQVYTHSSNEEVYVRFCCPLAAIYMKSTMFVTLLCLKCVSKRLHNTCKS